ncbi:MAG: hypothetical protein QOI10_441 [Solirubrobacterales bacterium]|jgi:uncharacterized protein (DUF1015 family)|nr:hypothetical protein [Solirubrobacterales bacterium]
MAEVRPLNALHYNLAAVPSLADVVAPPYDVIDAERRAALMARSPFNVVEIDLPVSPEGGDPYEHADETLEEWTLQGILSADREPALWALTQEYGGPDGSRRTRRGLLCRVRVTPYGPGLVRPHERTQPGPKEDRLRLTRATRHNLSPIFSLHEGDAWRHLEGYTRGEPWAEVTDDEGTSHRIWRIADADAHRAVAAELAESELLIADGHHRYETARTYADEIGGDGPHRYTLMALVSLEDPGLTVFGYHRLLSNLGERGPQEALGKAVRELFEVEEVPLDRLDPAGEEGIGVFGYIDAHHRQGYRLRLKDPAVLEAAMPDASPAFRELDAAILESLLLRDALGMSADDIEAKRGISYTASAEKALASLDEGTHAAFLMRPTPVQQVRDVAAAGETMPPKSTYFFPKLLTGIVFNPLS